MVDEIVELAGGVQAAVTKTRGGKLPGRVVLISVDASTRPPPTMDLSNEQPGLADTIGAMSDVQLHRYNVETIALTQASLRKWQAEMSTPERPVETYFVRLGLEQVPDAASREFLNAIPTSFDLSAEQVDRVVAAGRELLRNNAEFQRLVNDLGTPVVSKAN